MSLSFVSVITGLVPPIHVLAASPKAKRGCPRQAQA
jgi:hypothetical protein